MEVGRFGGSRAGDDWRREMRSKSGSLPPKSGDLTCMPQYIEDLYQSIPRRIRAVIRAKGSITKY